MIEDIQGEYCCRFVTEDEMPQVMTLWNTCFDDTMKFILWYFARYWKAEHTLGIFELHNEQELLQASAQIIPYNLQIRDAALPCGYIVGVDTAPEARNKGYAKRLLKECLQVQRERKQAISLLMPFEGQFYYRYGWSFCYFHQRIIIHPKELCCAAKSWGTIRKADLFESQKDLKRVYDSFASRYHGTVNRSEEQWRLQLEDAQIEHTICFLIEDENQCVQGYFLWTPLKDKCFVREIAWCHERAKAGMLYYLMKNVAAKDKVWLDLPENDSLKYQLAASKTDMILYPFLMTRIVDVKHCLESLHYPNITAQLMMTVQDDFAEWNTGTYHIAIENGFAQVKRTDEKTAAWSKLNEILHGSISIEGLSQLIMGARSAEQLLYQEVLYCEESDQTALLQLLAAIWPEQCNYINEYY